MKTLNLNLTLFGAASLAALSACEGTPVGEPAPASTPPPTASAAEDQTPVPVATLAFDTGQTVEFYDMGGGAFVSEHGAAGIPPVLGSMPETRADQLVDLWKRLAPGRAVPSSLVGLQDRMMRADGPDLARPGRPRVTIAPEFGGEPIFEDPPANVPSNLPEGTLAAPSGCNNGCCDYDWLKTFSHCSTAADYQWFLYNYGWSYGTVRDATLFRGLACAAIGTSTYKVSIEGGGGGTWSVAEAHYRTFYYLAPYCCNDPDITAKVNTSTTSALHTHCGYVQR